jgi:hypothetical protein
VAALSALVHMHINVFSYLISFPLGTWAVLFTPTLVLVAVVKHEMAQEVTVVGPAGGAAHACMVGH